MKAIKEYDDDIKRCENILDSFLIVRKKAEDSTTLKSITFKLKAESRAFEKQHITPDPLFIIPKRAEFDILKSEEEYWLIRYDGNYGYLHKSFFNNYSMEEKTASLNKLNHEQYLTSKEIEKLIGYVRTDIKEFKKNKGYKQAILKRTIHEEEVLAERKARKEIAAEKIANDGGCDYWKDETDPFEGVVKKYTKAQEIGYSRELGNVTLGDLDIELRKYGNERIMKANTVGISCVNSSSFISIKLKNGQIVKLYHFGDIDCDTAPSLFVKISESTSKKLSSSPIEIIRVRGSKHYSDIKFITNPSFFMHYLKCIK